MLNKLSIIKGFDKSSLMEFSKILAKFINMLTLKVLLINRQPQYRHEMRLEFELKEFEKLKNSIAFLFIRCRHQKQFLLF